MPKAMGMIEVLSIARGIYIADEMVKVANVEIFTASSTCPGKYGVIVYGDVAAVESSVSFGEELGGEFLIDSTVISNINPEVYESIVGTNMPDNMGALGILELFSLSTMIKAADSILKEADLKALELRLGNGLGGKSYFIFTGDVDSVKIGLYIGREMGKKEGLLVNAEIIPSPSDRILEFLY